MLLQLEVSRFGGIDQHEFFLLNNHMFNKMKSLFFSIVIIVGLLLLFYIIDSREFNCRSDALTVQSESSTNNGKPSASDSQTEPVTELKHAFETRPGKKPAETMPKEAKPATDARPKTDTKSAEEMPVEIKPVAETKPTETRPVANAKPEKKPVPTVVPAATAEEAETLNAEALVEFIIREKIRAKQKKRLDDGYGLTYSEEFISTRFVSLSKASEEQLLKKGYDIDEFRKRMIPQVWDIDYSTIPSDTFFQNGEEGFEVVSNQGPLRLVCKRFDGTRSSFIFEFSIKNNGVNDCEISFGVQNTGLIKSGYHELVSETISARETKHFEVELSVFEQLSDIAPSLAVHGTAILEKVEVFQKIHDDFTIVEGEITERSTLPDPESTDYPDCRFTAHFIGNAILSGSPCNKELSLSIDGFKNKSILNTNSLNVGDKIKCAIVPIDSVPDNLASIQEADELSLFALDSYLATTIQKISSYTDTTYLPISSTHFKSEHFDFKSVFDLCINPPITDDLALHQKERIQKDLEAANTMLQAYESVKETTERKFQIAWSGEKERFPDDYNTIKRSANDVLYWRNIDHSFWCLPARYTLVPLFFLYFTTKVLFCQKKNWTHCSHLEIFCRRMESSSSSRWFRIDMK